MAMRYKKIIAALSVLSIIFSFAGCSAQTYVNADTIISTKDIDNSEKEISDVETQDENDLPNDELGVNSGDNPAESSETSETSSEDKPEKEQNPSNNKEDEQNSGSEDSKKEPEKGKTPKEDYYIKVNKLACVVTVYTKDESGEYTVPYRAMICSPGSSTPTGTYTIKDKGRWTWLSLVGGVYGQYCTQIKGNYLFHSVPYTIKNDKSSLQWEEFDKLGTACSHGCIRLQVSDAKWIYDNRDNIGGVEIYSDSDPGPLGTPSSKKISDNETCRGWDPTDPDPNNPWITYVDSDGDQEGEKDEAEEENKEEQQDPQEPENPQEPEDPQEPEVPQTPPEEPGERPEPDGVPGHEPGKRPGENDKP